MCVKSFTEMAHFCRLHAKWLKNYFQLSYGIPSHDTFCRVFSAMGPAGCQTFFLEQVKSVVEIFSENIIPIDGKSIRSSHHDRANLKALHIVSAFSCANGISSRQMTVDKKTNKITVIPALLKKSCIEGAIITLDARKKLCHRFDLSPLNLQSVLINDTIHVEYNITKRINY